MKKLSEYKDEEALDLLADLLDPISVIAGDEEFRKAIGGNKRLAAVRIALKKYKPQVMEILAACEGIPVEEYHCNLLTAPMRLLDILMDKDLITGFTSQVREMKQGESSGPATVNTEGGEN